MHIFQTIEMLESPTLYPVVPSKTVKAVDVNDGETDIDLNSFLKERCVIIKFLKEEVFSTECDSHS